MLTPPAYPPQHHVMRDLQIVMDRTAVDRSLAIAPVGGHVRNAAGAACLGLIVTLIDVTGATVALAAASPDWPATADLAYQAIGPITDGPALAEASVVRRGSNSVVVGVEVFDGLGKDDVAGARHAGAGLMTFARIPRRASTVTVDPARSGGQRTTMARADSHLSAPLLERIGLRLVDGDAGTVELHKTDYVRNSFGTINGGVVGMTVQGSAEAACAGVGRQLVATDVQVHYLAQVKAGPLRASARVLRVGEDHAVCRVQAVDASQNDLVTALASVTLQAW
jgi:uncharacterized protein (TIGR00369 family)